MQNAPQETVFSLPVGRTRVLCRPLAIRDHLATGYFGFRGARLRLGCPPSVPMLGDADLATLAALSAPTAPSVCGLRVLDTHCGAAPTRWLSCSRGPRR